MSDRRRRRFRLIPRPSLAIISILLSGCAFTPQLSRVAVDHNRMVAQSTNELALLNIVRASHRFPLHFTAITEVTGNARVSMNASLEADLVSGTGSDIDIVSPATGGSVATSPSFRASVLATEEFQRGLQTPATPELVAYYLDEGWRDELIMSLMVERIEIYRDAHDPRPVKTIINNPSRDSEFARLLCTFGLRSEPTTASVPLASFDQLIDTESVEAAETSPAQRRKEITALLDLLGREEVRLSGDTLIIEGSNNSVRVVKRDSSRCKSVQPGEGIDEMILRPRFRSTLGMIYFLGEYQRFQSELGAESVYMLPSCEDPCRPGTEIQRPLIAIRKGRGESLVETHFRDERYFIGSDEIEGEFQGNRGTARSLQVIALIEQLVNLKKSSDTLPVSLSVTGVN